MNFWLYESETLVAMGNDAARVIRGVSKDAGPAAWDALNEIVAELESRHLDDPIKLAMAKWPQE